METAIQQTDHLYVMQTISMMQTNSGGPSIACSAPGGKKEQRIITDEIHISN